MTMRRSNFYYALIAFLVLAFSIGFGFVMEGILPINENDEGRTVYIVVKAIVSIAFLLVILFSMRKKNDPANDIITNVASILFLLLPLLVRFMATRENPKMVWIYLISFFIILAYLALVFSVDVLNQRVSKVAPKLVGKEIPLQNEDSYYDKDGNFVSAKNRGNE